MKLATFAVIRVLNLRFRSKMDNLYTLYYFLDIAGTFAFAVSGAMAARQKGLDLFGIASISFAVACGGGIIRDVCIGAIPPAGLSVWYYLFTAMVAAGMTIWLYPIVKKIKRPVLLFDAAGLSLFAVTGAEKTLFYGHNGEMAVLLGVVTAVGGGMLRDILLNRIPVVFEKEIYASAALMAAFIVVVGNHYKILPHDLLVIIALVGCFVLRMLALQYKWNLPHFQK